MPWQAGQGCPAARVLLVTSWPLVTEGPAPARPPFPPAHVAAAGGLERLPVLICFVRGADVWDAGACHASEPQQGNPRVLPPCGGMQAAGRRRRDRSWEGRLSRHGALLAVSGPQLRIFRTPVEFHRHTIQRALGLTRAPARGGRSSTTRKRSFLTIATMTSAMSSPILMSRSSASHASCPIM